MVIDGSKGSARLVFRVSDAFAGSVSALCLGISRSRICWAMNVDRNHEATE